MRLRTNPPPAVIVHESLPGRVLIGPGARHRVADEVDRLGTGGVLLVATPSARDPADELAARLGSRLAVRFDRPVVHTPVAVTAEVVSLVERAGVDCVVAIGGGSAIGLGKAVAARTGVQQIAVPTTYAGSEVTPVLGETENGVKTTRRDPGLAPGTVVYDPELTLGMPPGLTRTSAMNALAHAVEALWAPDATAVTDALATEAADGILRGLPGSPPPATWPRAGACSRRPGCPACAWPAPAWGCTTSSPTYWAARSTCRTRSCTPCCCRT
jgi:maleylacetate reductase